MSDPTHSIHLHLSNTEPWWDRCAELLREALDSPRSEYDMCAEPARKLYKLADLIRDEVEELALEDLYERDTSTALLAMELVTDALHDVRWDMLADIVVASAIDGAWGDELAEDAAELKEVA